MKLVRSIRNFCSDQKTITNLALFNIALAIAIILWGAWVRISGSGDGCGAHWPLCKGEIWPSLLSAETWIELLHRLKSGVFGITVVGVAVASRIAFPKNHPVRTAAVWGVLFTLTEALLGAKLVLFDLVGDDASLQRALTSALHLGNTTLLLGALTATFLWSQKEHSNSMVSWRRNAAVFYLVFFLIGATGSWAALASTLFPAETLAQGVAADFSADSHFLLRIRILHPVVALLGGIFLWIRFIMRKTNIFPNNLWGYWCKLCLPITILFGFLTLLSLSPTWMKLTHLALSTLTGIAIWSIIFSPRQPNLLPLTKKN